MEEKDLQGLWNKSGEQAASYYSEIEGEVLKKAKSQSHDILMKVRKNIIGELVVSGIVAVGFPLLYLGDKFIFWFLVVTMAAAMIVTLKVYLGYLREIKQVNESNVLKGLEMKVKVLAGYVKRLLTIVYVFAPIGFILGLIMTVSDHDYTFDENFTMVDILIQFVVSVPFFILFFWGFKKYVHVLYGKHLKSLKEVLEGLRE